MIAKVLVSQITIGERRRDDLGDVAGLAKSIEKHGLLQPIVIDADHNLVAGERRLRAMQHLNREWIEARQLGDLTETELHEIELEENLRRKDLTELERSKKMVERISVAREIVETCPESGQVSRPRRGPSRTPGSVRDIEERTGIPRSTAVEAERHVEAAVKYPEIAHYPKTEAIKASKYLDNLPEPERAAIREELKDLRSDAHAEVVGLPPLPKDMPYPGDAPALKWTSNMNKLRIRFRSLREHGGAADLAASWGEHNRSLYLSELIQFRSELDEWISVLEEEQAHVSDVA